MAKIRLLSWNVNGIRAVHRKNAMAWFFEDRPDILCLQETKATEDQIPTKLLRIEGYHSYFSAAERRGYSGVALYSRRKPKRVDCGLGVPEFDAEGRSLIAQYDRFMLYNIYFPNGKASKERLDYKMAFYDAFLQQVRKRTTKGEHVIICGDVNTAHTEIDLARPKENEKISGFLPEERAWIDTLIANGFVDTFRLFNDQPGSYSWWDLKTRARERNVGWRIDYVFVSESLRDNVKSAFILPDIMGSDHCPVGVEVEV